MLWRLAPGGGWDAVGINCKKGITTENQGADVENIWAKGCMFMIVCVLSDLTWWREIVMVYYFSFFHIAIHMHKCWGQHSWLSST